MELTRWGKEWYALEIATEPPVDAWEASFDDGETWHGSTEVGTDGWSNWLVAGTEADPAEAVAILPRGRTKPKIRGVDNPEIIVREPPYINVK